MPPKRRVVDVSAWVNESKIVACLSAAMPTPVSLTVKCSVTAGPVALPAPAGPSRSTCSTTSPVSVNFTALPTRFTRIWRSRAGSPLTAAGTPAPTW